MKFSTGRILNHFSKDTGFLDDLLPQVFLEFLLVSLSEFIIQSLHVCMVIHVHVRIRNCHNFSFVLIFLPAHNEVHCYHCNCLGCKRLHPDTSCVNHCVVPRSEMVLPQNIARSEETGGYM